MDKAEKRGEEVKQARQELKEKGAYKFFIEPTINYWKTQLLSALSTLFFWIIITYVIFSGLQAINNDVIYCDSSNDIYDGKLMYVFNEYVEWVNNNTQPTIDFYNQNPYQGLYPNEAQTSTIVCDYNWTKWTQEPIKERITTITYGFKKVTLKRS